MAIGFLFLFSFSSSSWLFHCSKAGCAPFKFLSPVQTSDESWKDTATGYTHAPSLPAWMDRGCLRFFWLFPRYSISPVQSASRNMTPTHACFYIFWWHLLFLFSASLGLPGCFIPIPLAPGCSSHKEIKIHRLPFPLDVNTLAEYTTQSSNCTQQCVTARGLL